MVPKNEQVSRNRASITEGSPRRISQVPRGSSSGAVAAIPRTPTTATAVLADQLSSRSCVPHWRAPADAAMSTPNQAALACSRWSRLDSSIPSSAAAICDASGEHQHDGDDDRHDDEPEHPPPGPGRRDPGGDRWPQQRGQHPGSGDHAEHLGPQRLRVGAADDDVARDDDEAGAQAGHPAPGEERSEAPATPPQTPQPTAKSSWPANSDGSGPDRSHQTPASTIPSSWVVSMTEKARP